MHNFQIIRQQHNRLLNALQTYYMMLPLNLNLQLNATSALWANDSTLETLHEHILKYDQLKYKKEGKGKTGSGCSFFGRGACA